MNTISFGVYGYSAHVIELGNRLEQTRQTLQSYRARQQRGVRQTESGADIVDVISAWEKRYEAEKSRYDRAASEL